MRPSEHLERLLSYYESELDHTSSLEVQAFFNDAIKEVKDIINWLR